MTQEKRTITPHKGDRSARFNGCRLTPAEKEAVTQMIKESGLSTSDWLATAAQHKTAINAIIAENQLQKKEEGGE